MKGFDSLHIDAIKIALPMFLLTIQGLGGRVPLVRVLVQEPCYETMHVNNKVIFLLNIFFHISSKHHTNSLYHSQDCTKS